MSGRTRIWWGVAASLSVGVALFSYRYLLGVGPLASNVMANLFRRPWLDLHVVGAATALLTAPFQLLAPLRARAPHIHRWIGRIYVLACLSGGVGGLVLAFGSTAGPIATLGFGSLAVCWLIANIQGWRFARARDFARHRVWMTRSFAMTFGAVTLRLYLPIFPLLGLPFIDGYRAASFLAWIPNLIVAELWLRGALAGRRSPVALAA